MNRLVIVTTSYPTSPDDPAGHFVATEAVELARKAEVVVLAPGPIAERRGENPRLERLPSGDAFGWPGAMARLRERPTRLVGATRFAREARARLHELHPDRVTAHWLLPSLWPIVFTPTGRRVVDGEVEAVAHGSDVEVLLALPTPIRDHWFARACAEGTRFRFVARHLRDRLVAATRHLDPSRCHVAPSPIDVDGCPEREAARRTLGVDPSRLLLVVVGRLVPSKRTDVALDAALRVPDATVVVVGDGPDRTQLERRFPGARFLGAQPRALALAWISAANALASASLREGAPTAVREARALGTPVVTLPAGDLAEQARFDTGLDVVDVDATGCSPVRSARGRGQLEATALADRLRRVSAARPT